MYSTLITVLLLAAGIFFGDSPAFVRAQQNSANDAHTFFVSPGHGCSTGECMKHSLGSDRNPFVSIAQARAAVRHRRHSSKLENITIRLLKGTHRLTTPLILGPEDAAPEGFVTTYEADVGAEITNSKLINPKSWSSVTSNSVLARFPMAARTHLLQLNLTALGINPLGKWPSISSRYLGDNSSIATPFLNGKSQFNSAFAFSRANNLTFQTVAQSWGTSTGSSYGGSFYYNYTLETAQTVEGWSNAVNEGRLYLRGFWRVPWDAPVLKVQSLDTSSKTLQFQQDLGKPVDGSGSGIGLKYARPLGALTYPPVQQYWTVNLIEDLSNPSQWVTDFDSGTLFYWPPTDLDSSTVEIADLLEPLIVLNKTSNIVLKNIKFRSTIYEQVVIDGGKDITVDSCEFMESTRGALVIKNSPGSGVQNSHLHDLGGGGAYMYHTDTSSLANDQNYAVNNTIHDYGKVQIIYCPAIGVGSYVWTSDLQKTLTATGNYVAYNRVFNSPHNAIMYQGLDHTIEYNEVYNTAEYLADMGAIYTYPASLTGNVTIRNNYVHDIPSQSSAIYFDGSPTVSSLIVDNVIFNINRNGVPPGQIGPTGSGIYFNQPATNSTILNNIIIQSGVGMNFNGDSAPPNASITLNAIVLGPTKRSFSAKGISGYSPPRNLVIANIADAGFVNVEQQNWGLNSDSVIFQSLPGFQEPKFPVGK